MNDSAANDVVVSLRYGDLDGAIEWCVDNCRHEWDLAEIEEFGGFANGVYHFSFVDDRDAMIFALRWS